ncbi:hypothetical protein [Seonamhaeicola sp.]|uniref:hypothetical protein n=1 Tax=Seonamhaeicola sp. TaxID=1912245 RepID=UPI002623B9D1|nr:hypothetical protein [Seonamhaeicola sp.]
MNAWFYIGIGLIIWVLYDLYKGVTWTFRPIHRQHEPNAYWLVTLIWITIAVTTLLAGSGWL